jgi:methionyl-tRNA formyltransferase
MKVIIFGCQAISIEIMRYLHGRHDIDIPRVYTYEVLSDISRGQESVIDVANELGINIYSPNRVSMNVVNEIKEINPDIIISAYYRKIFPKTLFDASKLGVINIHPSLLPYYRGPVPTAWAIINNEKEFGITIHQVDAGIDTGDILVQKKYDIDEDETGYELYLRAMEKGAKLLIDNFDDIIHNKNKPKKQSPGGSYFGKLNSRVLIDWREKASYIKNQVRVRAIPYNPIETILENKYFFINKVSIIKNNKYPIQVPGKILKVYDDNTFDVSCSNGALHVEEYDVYPPFSKIEKEIYLKAGQSFSNG